MTPKIARFLAEQQPATPCLVLDVDRVEDNFRALQRALPLARIYYAVKANPAPPDAGAAGRASAPASMPRASRRSPAAWTPARGRRRSASATRSRRRRRSARAFQRGVTLFAFDSAEELEKLAEHAPGARVYCRILVENEGADWPLSRKFGTTVENAARADAARRRDGARSVRAVVPCRQPADHDARLRGGDRQGGDAVHRPDRGRRQPAHDEPRRRLPDALPRRRCRRSTSSAMRS